MAAPPPGLTLAVSTDILATYRRPAAVVRSHFARGVSEPRALSFVMIACMLVFVAQWPRLSREAFLTGEELEPMLGGALLGWLIIAPLMMYALAAIGRLVVRVAGLRMSGFGARLALFWALLASTPLLLLFGLVGGFVGAGAAQSLVGLVWVAVFLWFWITGLRVAAEEAA